MLTLQASSAFHPSWERRLGEEMKALWDFVIDELIPLDHADAADCEEPVRVEGLRCRCGRLMWTKAFFILLVFLFATTSLYFYWLISAGIAARSQAP